MSLFKPFLAPISNPKSTRPSSIVLAPSMSSFKGPAKKWVDSPASSPVISFHKHHHRKKKYINSAPRPVYSQRGPSVSPVQSPLQESSSWASHVPAPSPIVLSSHFNIPTLQPTMSPMGSSLKSMKSPPLLVIMTLPPPPPNDGKLIGMKHLKL